MKIKKFTFLSLCICFTLSLIFIAFMFFYMLNNQKEDMELIQKLSTQLTALVNKNKALSIEHKAEVILTAYCPWEGGINSDEYPNKTATMTKPIPGWTCALSKELVHKGWLGRKIYVEGYGIFKAEDRMSPSLEGKRIDLCVGTVKEAYKIGKNKNIFTTCL